MTVQAKTGGFKLLDKRRSVLLSAGVILAACLAVLAYNRAGKVVPNVLVLQRAYDSEANSGNAGHDANLLVIDALRKPRQQSGAYLCVVAFTDRRDTGRQLFYDIAEVNSEGSDWRLKSGLCKR